MPSKSAAMDKNNDDSSVDSQRFDTSALRFRAPAKASSKVVLDERFSSVLTDERFQLQVHDKYGRKNKKKSSAKDELSAFYTIDDSNAAETIEKPRKSRSKPSRKPRDEGSDSNDDEKGNDEQTEPASRIAYLTALSRGQLDVSSSSEDSDTAESESSASDHDSDEDSLDADADVEGILDPSTKEDIEITDEKTRYLAVTNMDWTNVRAVDIFALLSSFVPPSAVLRVRVFVSDFGQEKLGDLERFGPRGVWKKSSLEDARLDEQSESGSEAADENSIGDDGYTANPSGNNDDNVESDFDQEKLRAYEASKLRYYFAVAEFDSAESAEKAYQEVDGMEFEHSSAEVDLRAIPEADLDTVVKDRPLRDEASRLPSNYSPPDFIVSALQQTNVTCTWDLSDMERERTLTKYNSGEHWRTIAESEDLKAYLASDVSSDEEEEGDKAMMLRKNLGLDSDSDDASLDKGVQAGQHSSSDNDDFLQDDNFEQEASDNEKEFTFVPGAKKADLAEKIQTKVSAPKASEELTPWEKYKEKRKKKRQERRQMTRIKRSDTSSSDKRGSDEVGGHENADDSRAALELLVAGEENDDSQMDYDMRGLERAEKIKSKNLKGSRKRKESQRADALVGAAFDVDVKDTRFQAVLDGTDDRFGIDQTDSNFKKTPGMLKILKEQTSRRKKQRMGPKAPGVTAPIASDDKPTGAKALSAIVQSLKAKHN